MENCLIEKYKINFLHSDGISSDFNATFDIIVLKNDVSSFEL